MKELAIRMERLPSSPVVHKRVVTLDTNLAEMGRDCQRPRSVTVCPSSISCRSVHHTSPASSACPSASSACPARSASSACPSEASPFHSRVVVHPRMTCLPRMTAWLLACLLCRVGWPRSDHHTAFSHFFHQHH